MNTKDYAEVLKFAIKTQIGYVEEENNGAFSTDYSNGFFDGVKRGLEIALEKIDASMFLVKE